MPSLINRPISWPSLSFGPVNLVNSPNFRPHKPFHSNTSTPPIDNRKEKVMDLLKERKMQYTLASRWG